MTSFMGGGAKSLFQMKQWVHLCAENLPWFYETFSFTAKPLLFKNWVTLKREGAAEPHTVFGKKPQILSSHDQEK
jgi:hypothetical protein